MPATRVEIAGALAGAFANGPVSRAGLISAAADAGARSEVIGVLERLGRGPYYELRNLWGSIPDVPIEPVGAGPSTVS